jgi:hypothetical protein
MLDKYKPPYTFFTHIGAACAKQFRMFADLAERLNVTARQTCRNLVTQVKPLLSKPLPSSWSVSWFWFTWQIVFALCTIYLLAHPPVPGISVGVLGLLAVVATFERDPSSLQRSIWIIVATVLFIVEVNAITSDRLESEGEQANARAVNQSQFLKTAKALQKAISDEEEQTAKEQIQFNPIFPLPFGQ